MDRPAHEGYTKPSSPAELALADKCDKLEVALSHIEIKAQAGLCYFTLESAREFLKDIRDEVADALGNERPRR